MILVRKLNLVTCHQVSVIIPENLYIWGEALLKWHDVSFALLPQQLLFLHVHLIIIICLRIDYDRLILIGKMLAFFIDEITLTPFVLSAHHVSLLLLQHFAGILVFDVGLRLLTEINLF